MPAKRPFVSFSEVKEKISIPDVLEVLGIAQQFTRKADHLSGCCPLPQHRHGPRPNPEQFKIDCKRGTWLYKCFGDCSGQPGGAGDVIEFVKAMTGLSDAHVRFWFADKFGERLAVARPRDGTRSPEKRAAREDHANVHSQAPHNATPNLPDVPPPLKPLKFFLNLDPAVPYLRERGVSEEAIQRYSMGLCSRGVLKGYVAIPVYNWPRPESELPVGYFGRWPGEDFDDTKGRPRYKWPVDFPRQQVVYGLPEALADSEPGTPLSVVSSPFSVFHCFQQGFPAVVAICDSSLSDQQGAVLANTGRPIVLMLGGDEQARQEMRQAAAKLIKSAFVRVAALPDGVGPQTLTREQLAAWLA
jgi:DNA primase